MSFKKQKIFAFNFGALYYATENFESLPHRDSLNITNLLFILQVVQDNSCGSITLEMKEAASKPKEH